MRHATLHAVPAYPTAPRGRPVHLASNESALGPSPAALAAAAGALAGCYPDPDAARLRAALAAHLGADAVCATNGATEAIQLLVRAIDGEVVVPAASFPLYVRSALAAGRVVRQAPRRADHRVDLDALTAAITPRTGLVFLACPDNPTGTTPDGLDGWLRSLPAHVIPVIDHAYVEFDGPPVALDAHPNLIVLRSFSKAYGLAGLRVGAAAGAARVIAALDRVRDPFNVSAPAEAAALAALADHAWLADVRRANAAARADLAAALTARGYSPLPSAANFLFLPAAAGLADSLDAHGVAIRRLHAWGYPDAARVTVGRPDQHAALLSALDGAWRCAS